MNGISTSTANHDFFSQVGNGYRLGQVEAMEDDDYSFSTEDKGHKDYLAHDSKTAFADN